MVLAFRALLSTEVDILCFHYHMYNLWLRVFHSKIYLQSCNTDLYLELNFTHKIYFQSLEVVYRGSETQLPRHKDHVSVLSVTDVSSPWG